MDSDFFLIAHTASPVETRQVGQCLASCLEPGDVVLLSGDLGAGKTQFVQGVASGLGAVEVPVSPTFNIVLSYGSGRLPLHHFDLYRLDSPDQLEDIGLSEYLESGGVCFVEWAAKFPEAFDEFLAVDIAKVSNGERLLRARAVGKRAGELLSAWKAALSGAVSGREGCVQKLAFRDDEESVEKLRSLHSALPSRDGTSAVSVREDTCYVLAFDTANEVVAIGLGALDRDARRVSAVATREIPAHRASNTTLLPAVDALLGECGVARSSVACVCAGRGPGSFTGVRIAMAAAKGIASALGVGLVGVSTLDAIAWNAWAAGVRGDVLVMADAMRKEVYPAWFSLSDEGAFRLTADRVVKANAFASELSVPLGTGGPLSLVLASAAAESLKGASGSQRDYEGPSASYDAAVERLLIVGDGLVKYRELFEPFGRVLSDKLWEVSGRGLLLALENAWRAGQADPFDAARHDPALALPVYTRLSDAEENERAKLALNEDKNLVAGVQDVAAHGGAGRATMHAQAVLAAPIDDAGVSYRPLASADAAAVAALEGAVMGTDAWSEHLVADELGRRDRLWWVAEQGGSLVGYAGGLVVDGDLQVLKIAVDPAWRRRGIARELLVRLGEDARNLGAASCSLEVRASNAGAQAFYGALGFESVGVRPRYYSDREDAVIMRGPLPVASRDVAGMELQHLESGLSGPALGREGCVQKLDFRYDDENAENLRSLHSAFPSQGRACSSGAENKKRGDGAGDLAGVLAQPAVKRPLILAIESSCDETAAAVVNGRGELPSDVVASQIDFHARFGGVVPEIASRKHIEAICGVCDEALAVAGVGWDDLDSVAVTYAPGLLGALVVGVAFAKGAAWALDVPLIGVNHLEGHLYANKIGCPGFAPPAVVSLVSGGNTLLVHMRGWGDYETLGSTIDDAVGEAFDKVSKALGLGYPGGPAISKAAASGDPAAIDFPRAMLHSHDLRFSLSGLKTAVVNHINGERAAERELNIPDIAASFQQAVIDVQLAKAKTALEQTGAPTFCLGGGVAANPALRAAYEKLCAEMGVELVMPPLSSCGDNAGMIALVALDRYRAGRFFDLSADAQAHAGLDEPY